MVSPKQRPAVAVFDAQSPPALAFVRSLGQAGIPVRVYSPIAFPVCRLSRYAMDFKFCPELSDAPSFIAFLKKEVKAGLIYLVAPTSDLLAFYMAEYPESFPALQQKAIPKAQNILNMLLKDRFEATCKQANIPTPLTFCPTNNHEAVKLSANLPYPIILKPKSHIGVGLARGLVVQNPMELKQGFKPYAIDPIHAPFVAKFPELAWPMIQAYVPGALKYLYSISGVVDQTSRVITYSGSQKIMQWPPRLGVGVVFEAWKDQQAIEQGLTFVSQHLGTGIFELEFIYDAENKQYLAIDLNPRAHGHISFDIARNQNLPLLWYQIATSQPLQKTPDHNENIRWLHSIPYHVGHALGWIKGPQRSQWYQHWIQGLKGKTVDIIFDKQDPLPAIAHAYYMLQHPGGLIRPLWKEAELFKSEIKK